MASDPSENEYETALSGWFSPKAPAGASGEKPAQGFGRKNAPGQAAALDQVRLWVKERFSLADDAAILVSEVACTLPGCPPLETVVAFWSEDKRHHFKLMKRAEEVVHDDIPFAWLKDTFVVADGFGCECC
jgi:hypothetical protein